MRADYLTITRDKFLHARMLWLGLELEAASHGALVGQSSYVWTDADYRSLADTARSLNMRPDHLLAVMYSETWPRLDPSSRNPAGAVGLIQFTTGGGFSEAELETIVRLPPTGQMPYVRRYFGKWGNRTYPTAGSIYAFVFTPGRALSRGTSPDSVMAAAPEGFYENNKILDVNKDGRITVSDLESNIERLRAQPLFQQHLARLNAVAGTTAPPSPVTPTRVAAAGAGLGALLALGGIVFVLAR